ncbi:MAG: complex I NDUFA9 subunit family protein, partial [Roseovarius sp.]
MNLFARLQRVFPFMPLAGANARFQPVWVENVAAAVARCLQDRGSIGQTYELCGPVVMTLRE